MTTIDTTNREFEIGKQIAAILDPLSSDRQKQVMALLRTQSKEYEIASQVSDLLNTLKSPHRAQLMAMLGKRFDPWTAKAKPSTPVKRKPSYRKN